MNYRTPKSRAAVGVGGGGVGGGGEEGVAAQKTVATGGEAWGCQHKNCTSETESVPSEFTTSLLQRYKSFWELQLPFLSC